MKILLTGTSGQVGGELRRLLSVLGELIMPARAELDLGKPEQIGAFLNQHRPDLIVNPAAYTAVDKAESEPDLARAINTESPAELAAWCAANNVPLVHYSTDYVYGGRGVTPFDEHSACEPDNVYAQTKLAGEQAIAASACTHLIFRTSWVYGVRGKNFLNTMLALAETKPQLGVVNDQIGAPTPASMIAAVTLATLAKARSVDQLAACSGIYNLAPSGFISWHTFAEAIMAQRAAMTDKQGPQVNAIPTSDYPTAASRPLNSRLDCTKLSNTFGWHQPDWREQLQTVMNERLSS